MSSILALLTIIISAASGLVFQSVQRQITINSLIVRTEIATSFQHNEQGWIIFSLEESLAAGLSYITFYNPTKQQDYSSRKVPCSDVVLPETDGTLGACWQVQVKEKEGRLNVKAASLTSLRISKEKAHLRDPLQFKFQFSPTLPTAYEIVKQETTIR